MEPTTEMHLAPEVQSGEDFVHIDNTKTLGDISLSDSIVNVEKTEVEEQSGDCDSVVTGVDFIGDSGEADIGGEAEFGEREVKTTKLELPEEFAKSVMVLTCESSDEGGSCDVYLIGTAHVWQESCREVEAIVSYMKPQVVFVELCSGRLSILNPQTVKIPTMSEMIDMWKRNHNIFGIAYGW